MVTKTRQSQIAKFRAAARELGANDNEKRFNEKLGKIAKAKPSDPPKKSKSKKDGWLTGPPYISGEKIA